MLVDDDSTDKILSIKVMVQIEIPSSKLMLVKTPLIGITGSGVPVKGALELLIIMGTLPMCLTSTKLHGDQYIISV
jgi:hypothetical protein